MERISSEVFTGDIDPRQPLDSRFRKRGGIVIDFLRKSSQISSIADTPYPGGRLSSVLCTDDDGITRFNLPEKCRQKRTKEMENIGEPLVISTDGETPSRILLMAGASKKSNIVVTYNGAGDASMMKENLLQRGGKEGREAKIAQFSSRAIRDVYSDPSLCPRRTIVTGAHPGKDIAGIIEEMQTRLGAVSAIDTILTKKAAGESSRAPFIEGVIFIPKLLTLDYRDRFFLLLKGGDAPDLDGDLKELFNGAEME